MSMSNQKEVVSVLSTEVTCKITKTSYDKIVKNINDTWPQWKKNLCNQELIVSVKSKKL